MTECPHRTIKETGTLRCALLPGEILTGPNSAGYLCNACDAMQPNKADVTPSLLDRALEVGQYIPSAPFKTTAIERMAVCVSCPQWRRNKCRMHCEACRTDRPDPEAEIGPNCPQGKWRRPITKE